jgi:DNA-directed RNA polymerase specialized sigma24 family protein
MNLEVADAGQAPEEKLIVDDELAQLLRSARPLVRRIAHYRLEGVAYHEISRVLGIPMNEITNTCIAWSLEIRNLK